MAKYNNVLAFTLFLLLFTATTTTTTMALSPITKANYLTPYAQHCADKVPIEQERSWVGTRKEERVSKLLHFDIAYLSGGKGLFFHDQRQTASSGSGSASLSFDIEERKIFNTDRTGVFHIVAWLKLNGVGVKERSILMRLFGFWSELSGDVCMVGSLVSVGGFDAVLKLKYPVGSLSIGSLITGVFESFDDVGRSKPFKAVSIVAVPHSGHFSYELVARNNGSVCSGRNGDDGESDENSLSIHWNDPGECLSNFKRFIIPFKLEFEDGCDNKCNPLGDADTNFLPKFMILEAIGCQAGGKIRALLEFLDSGDLDKKAASGLRAFNPDRMLIAEGAWDERRNRFCVVACRLLNGKGSRAKASVGDCSVRLSLRFRKMLTIEKIDPVVGQIWSNNSANDRSYFDRIRLHFHRYAHRNEIFPDVIYFYTKLDEVKKACLEHNSLEGKGVAYPSWKSTDMDFDLFVKNEKGESVNGHASVLSAWHWDKLGYTFGDLRPGHIYEEAEKSRDINPLISKYNEAVKVMSYTFKFDVTSDSKASGSSPYEISAEGTYDNVTGHLCMIGCRRLEPRANYPEENETDCKILINLQFFPMLPSKGGFDINGTFQSMRRRSDPLYFGIIQVSKSKFYKVYAEECTSLIKGDVILAFSCSIPACLFIYFQIRHVRGHPNVLPSVSLLMLLVLSSGYLIPPLLKIRAAHRPDQDPPKQDLFLDTGGYLAACAILARLIQLVAFLMMACILDAFIRNSNTNIQTLPVSQWRVLWSIIVLYTFGGLIAWNQVQGNTATFNDSYLRPRHWVAEQQYPCKHLQSFGDAVVDGFLFPQIVLNSCLNRNTVTLHPAFYIGITAVRLAPHIYHLCIKKYHSTVWDIIILTFGILFAAIVYRQQRFGGHAFIRQLPRRD